MEILVDARVGHCSLTGGCWGWGFLCPEEQSLAYETGMLDLSLFLFVKAV